MLQNKKILLGISGGIAAYKCASLVRLLVKSGAEVKVIMTRSAHEFITPQTLSVLSKNPVHTEFFNGKGEWNSHVELAEWADLLLIAPLTANTLAKMANGICDNLLLAVYLSSRNKTMVAPAMDLEMYNHLTTKENLEKIKSNKVIIIPAEKGELASGLSGEGRMAEPETIVAKVTEHFKQDLPFKDKKVLINAGPTYEAIDPVRFIGNRSSGKMGISIAEEFLKQGAEVTLVLGPTHLLPQLKEIKLIRVETAAQMLDECTSVFESASIAVCCAAVADYKVADVSNSKIKKTGKDLELKLSPTTDILKTLGEKKKQGQFLVGFALETEHVIEYASDKLKRKNLDLIIANKAGEENSAFSSDNNQISIIDKHNKITNFELKPKTEVARDIVDHILKNLH